MIQTTWKALGLGGNAPNTGDMTILQLLTYHSLNDDLNEEWHDRLNEFFIDNWGFATQKDYGHLHKRIFEWNPDVFADQVKQSVMDMYRKEIDTLQKKLDKILEHIGDTPVTKTLKEEVGVIEEVSQG